MSYENGQMSDQEQQSLSDEDEEQEDLSDKNEKKQELLSDKR